MSSISSSIESLVRAELRNYPALSSYVFLTPLRKWVTVEARTDPQLPFFPNLTRDWISDKNRVARLFLFGKDGTALFEKDAETATIEDFVRALEISLGNHTFRAAAMATRTLVPDQARNVAVFCMAPRTLALPLDKILSGLLLDHATLRLLSLPFQHLFKERTRFFVEDLGVNLLRYEEITKKPIEKDSVFDGVVISPIGIHKDVKLFSITEGKTTAAVMIHEGKVSIQSFTATTDALVELLIHALLVISTENMRISMSVL